MDNYMKAAIEEARKSSNESEIPIGSALVKNGQIIGRGHNKRVQQNNPMHAERDCLRRSPRSPSSTSQARLVL